MSSAFRGIAQVDGRTKFFAAVNTVTEYLPAAGATFRSVMTIAQFTAAISSTPTIAIGALFRDLGSEVTVVNAITGQHVAKFRLVQLQNGTSSEGVDTVLTPFYICTWTSEYDDASYQVDVARIG
jgi:hypothetical protein